MKRSEGKKKLVLQGHLNDFVTRRTKILFESFGVVDVEEYCGDALRHSINAFALVNALTEKSCKTLKNEQQKQILMWIKG